MKMLVTKAALAASVALATLLVADAAFARSYRDQALRQFQSEDYAPIRGQQDEIQTDLNDRTSFPLCGRRPAEVRNQRPEPAFSARRCEPRSSRPCAGFFACGRR